MGASTLASPIVHRLTRVPVPRAAAVAEVLASAAPVEVVIKEAATSSSSLELEDATSTDDSTHGEVHQRPDTPGPAAIRQSQTPALLLGRTRGPVV